MLQHNNNSGVNTQAFHTDPINRNLITHRHLHTHTHTTHTDPINRNMITHRHLHPLPPHTNTYTHTHTHTHTHIHTHTSLMTMMWAPQPSEFWLDVSRCRQTPTHSHPLPPHPLPTHTLLTDDHDMGAIAVRVLVGRVKVTGVESSITQVAMHDAQPHRRLLRWLVLAGVGRLRVVPAPFADKRQHHLVTDTRGFRVNTGDLKSALEAIILVELMLSLVDRFYTALFSTLEQTLCSHEILQEWIAFYSVFLTIHWNGVLTALAWLVPHETAAVSALSAHPIQPCTMPLHAKPHTCSAVICCGWDLLLLLQ